MFVVGSLGAGAVWLGLIEGVAEATAHIAMVATVAPESLRGTVFGIFNLLRGVLLLLASVIAGLLWDVAGPAATFQIAPVLAAISLVLMSLSRTMSRRGS